MVPSISRSDRRQGVSCVGNLVAAAGVRHTAAQIADARRTPEPFFGRPLRPALLKNADDQSVVVLAAIRHALEDSALPPDDFTDWGMVAAPQQPGRSVMRQELGKFAAEGAWGVSPHIIPNCSLHSASGLFAQVLQLQGPNLGVGGVSGSESAALPAAFGMLAAGGLAGVWVVWSGWQQEPSALDGDPGAECLAFAMALSPLPDDWHGPRLHLLMPGTEPPGGGTRFGLNSLMTIWEAGLTGPDTVWDLDGNGWVVLEGPEPFGGRES